jgi:hypothetical protein
MTPVVGRESRFHPDERRRICQVTGWGDRFVDGERFPVPAGSALLDVAEAREWREMEDEEQRALRRRAIEQPPPARESVVRVLVPHGSPARMLEVDRMQGGIRDVEQLRALRPQRDRDVAGRVARRRQDVDARRDLDLTVDEIDPIRRSGPAG